MPAGGAFSEHYYGHRSFRVEPEITCAREVDSRRLTLPIKDLLVLSFGYAYDRRAHRDREAKDKDAAVGGKGENEGDVIYPFARRRVYPLHKNCAFLLQARKAMARSNFEDERVYRYNYDINILGLGIQYRL